MIVWSKLGLSDFLYEMVPAFAASLLAVYIVSLLTNKPSAQVSERFSEFTKSM